MRRLQSRSRDFVGIGLKQANQLFQSEPMSHFQVRAREVLKPAVPFKTLRTLENDELFQDFGSSDELAVGRYQ